MSSQAVLRSQRLHMREPNRFAFRCLAWPRGGYRRGSIRSRGNQFDHSANDELVASLATSDIESIGANRAEDRADDVKPCPRVHERPRRGASAAPDHRGGGWLVDAGCVD